MVKKMQQVTETLEKTTGDKAAHFAVNVKRPVVLDLVHYGSSKYDPDKFIPPTRKATIGVKPKGGFWASPVDSEYGWIDWCRDNEWGDLSKHFFCKFHGLLLVVDSISDMERLPWVDGRWNPEIDFGKVIDQYDGMMVTAKGEQDTRFTYPKSLYGWDCESVVVFNQDAIIT